jgi:hypothetical protein
MTPSKVALSTFSISTVSSSDRAVSTSGPATLTNPMIVNITSEMTQHQAVQQRIIETRPDGAGASASASSEGLEDAMESREVEMRVRASSGRIVPSVALSQSSRALPFTGILCCERTDPDRSGPASLDWLTVRPFVMKNCREVEPARERPLSDDDGCTSASVLLDFVDAVSTFLLEVPLAESGSLMVTLAERWLARVEELLFRDLVVAGNSPASNGSVGAGGAAGAGSFTAVSAPDVIGSKLQPVEEDGGPCGLFTGSGSSSSSSSQSS